MAAINTLSAFLECITEILEPTMRITCHSAKSYIKNYYLFCGLNKKCVYIWLKINLD
jgi:hypothetical protein